MGKYKGAVHELEITVIPFPESHDSNSVLILGNALCRYALVFV